MIEHFSFYIGLAFIFVHEMDAVRLQEWKMFPFLSNIKDESGYKIFTIIHLPIYFLLFWGLFGNQGTNHSLILGLDVFFIIHVGLHLLFLKNKNNQFKSTFSWGLILLTGLFGLADLIISF
jgi:hypothetical protein